MRPSYGVVDFGDQGRNFTRMYLLHRIETSYFNTVAELAELLDKLDGGKAGIPTELLFDIRLWAFKNHLGRDPNASYAPTFDEWVDWQSWRSLVEDYPLFSQAFSDPFGDSQFTYTSEYVKYLYENRPLSNDAYYENEWDKWIKEMALDTLQNWQKWGFDEEFFSRFYRKS